MSDGVAYTSTAAAVLDAWQAYQDHCEDVRARRAEISERYGRRLMLNSSEFGHGTRVTGFELFDDDVPGETVGDHAELRVPKGGHNAHVLQPNLRRKAGQDLHTELTSLTQDGPDLPGMPGWTLVGLSVLRPAIFVHDGAAWVRWVEPIDTSTQAGLVDLHLWAPVPLSTYYVAREAYDATKTEDAA